MDKLKDAIKDLEIKIIEKRKELKNLKIRTIHQC